MTEISGSIVFQFPQSLANSFLRSVSVKSFTECFQNWRYKLERMGTRDDEYDYLFKGKAKLPWLRRWWTWIIFLSSCPDWWLWRREVQPALQIYEKWIQFGVQVHYWCGVRYEVDTSWREDDQGPDLGHGRPGEVQGHHLRLLQRSCRGSPCLRYRWMTNSKYKVL